MEILLLLLLLQIKHLYADFKIQTYMQTVKKGVWLDPIGISHSLDHVWGSLVVLLLFSFVIPLPPILILIVAFFILRWLNNYKDNLAVEAQFILFEATRKLDL